jgi:outer membrane receptor for ferric coprogen and ferric-rhodotorulic acid
VFGSPDRATEAGLTGYACEYLLADERKTFDVYVEGDFVFLNREHQVVFGVNTAVAEYTDQSLYDFTTGNGFPEIPNLQTWKGNAVYPTLADGLAGSAVKQTQDAWYATGRFSIIDSLHLMLGGRYNQWETKGTSYRVDRTVKDSDFIPFAGLVYDITDDINVYTSYTETFQAQQELDINNQQLDPIVGQSQEIGFKFDLFNEQAVASIAYFDVQQTNLAILDPQTADFAPDAVRYIGSNGISSHGFELDIAGEILPDLQASIGFTDFSISGESTVAAYTPGQLFKMGLVYTVDQDLSTGINIRWQDDISRDQGVVGEGFGNAGETIITRQETYAVVDLMAKYQVNKSVSVALNVQNATDKKYLTSLYWAQGFYAPPRTISATLSWTL